MASIATARIKREFKEVVTSDEVIKKISAFSSSSLFDYLHFDNVIAKQMQSQVRIS
jgi:hypothetical protein